MTILNTAASRAAFATALLLWTGAAAVAQADADERGVIVLGLGAAMEPVFAGSDRTRVEPAPIIEARYGRVSMGELGVGFDIFASDGPSGLTFGVAIGPGEGRRERDDARLAGLGNLDGAVELAVFAEAEWGVLEFDASVVTDVGSGHGGTFLNLGVGFENTLSDRLSYEVEVSTIYGDDTYANVLYGVSAAQSALSGYAPFSPGAGFTEASLDLSIRYAITDTWFAEATVGVGTLLGEARNAPFAPRDSFTSASIGIGRVFRF